MENNIYVYITICILLILYIFINCNTNYNNDKNIISYNILIIFFILCLVFLNRNYNYNYNEYFNTVATATTTTAPTIAPATALTTTEPTTALTTTAPATLVKYGHLKKPISYKDIIYGKPIFYWEGNDIISDLNPIYNIFELKGDCTINKDNTTVVYTNTRKYMLRFLNTSNTNSFPTNYVLFKLPIDPTTHNTVFIQVRARDKWSNINMCICNNSTKEPEKKIATLCNTINRSDWHGNTSLIGPHNNVALSANGYNEWLSFPISYNDILKYKDSENNIYISLNQGITENFIYSNIEISGIATTTNPYGVYIVPISNYQFQNFEILNNSYESFAKNEILKLDNRLNSDIIKNISLIEQEDHDQQIVFINGNNYNNLIKINIPVIDNNCGLIIGFITRNKQFSDINPIIYINNNFYKKYILNNLLVGRVGMSLIGRGQLRHPKGIYLSKEFVKNNVIMSNDNINYISIYIDISNDTNSLYLRAVYSESVESNTENYIINPAPTKILYDFNNQPISYMENIYGEPIYYWEGFRTIKNDLDIIKRFSVINCNMNNTYYINSLDKRNLFHFNNTSDTNLTPTNFILLRVPINPLTHNTIFLKVRAGDRWTALNMFLCSKNMAPVNKIISIAGTHSTNTTGIGPFNNVSYEGNYEWIAFPISKIYNTSEFVTDNEICVSINKAINGQSDIYIAGVAVCANPYAVTSLRAINLHWNHNGCFLKNATGWTETGITWNSHVWEYDSLAQINNGDIYKIRIPVLNDDKGVIVGIITHNSNWYDGNPRIYFEANPNVFYMLSPLVIGKYGLANMNRGLHRASRGFFISADDVKTNIKKSFDSTKFMFLEIIIDNLLEIRPIYIRSIYTEAVEPV
jgi:hypothetical protein